MLNFNTNAIYDNRNLRSALGLVEQFRFSHTVPKNCLKSTHWYILVRVMVMQAYTGKSNLISYEYYMKIKQDWISLSIPSSQGIIYTSFMHVYVLLNREWYQLGACASWYHTVGEADWDAMSERCLELIIRFVTSVSNYMKKWTRKSVILPHI